MAKIDREKFPNSGAVLLRVFFEFAVRDYLERIGQLPKIIKNIESKTGGKLPFGTHALKQLVPDNIRIAKKKLTRLATTNVHKANKYHHSARYKTNNLHGFVHQDDFPCARDILQFWKRTEPLFRLMLEEEPEGAEE